MLKPSVLCVYPHQEINTAVVEGAQVVVRGKQPEYRMRFHLEPALVPPRSVAAKICIGNRDRESEGSMPAGSIAGGKKIYNLGTKTREPSQRARINQKSK